MFQNKNYNNANILGSGSRGMESINQKQIQLHLYSSRDSFDGDSNSFNQFGMSGDNNLGPGVIRLGGSDHGSGGYKNEHYKNHDNIGH